MGKFEVTVKLLDYSPVIKWLSGRLCSDQLFVPLSREVSDGRSDPQCPHVLLSCVPELTHSGPCLPRTIKASPSISVSLRHEHHQFSFSNVVAEILQGEEAFAACSNKIFWWTVSIVEMKMRLTWTIELVPLFRSLKKELNRVHLCYFSRFHICVLIYDICFSLSDLLHSTGIETERTDVQTRRDGEGGMSWRLGLAYIYDHV